MTDRIQGLIAAMEKDCDWPLDGEERNLIAIVAEQYAAERYAAGKADGMDELLDSLHEKLVAEACQLSASEDVPMHYGWALSKEGVFHQTVITGGNDKASLLKYLGIGND